MASMVTCPGCGKQYRFKDELAGKKVRCKCSQTFRMPQVDPGLAADMDLDPVGEFELADQSPLNASAFNAPPLPSESFASDPTLDEPPKQSTSCPACGAQMEATAVVCVACGLNKATGRQMTTTGKGMRHDDDALKERDQRAQNRAYKIAEYYAPMALTIIGFFGWVAISQELFSDPEWGVEFSFGQAATAIAINSAIAVAMLVAGCFVAAKLLDTGFGSLGTAIVKLAGIYLFTGALIDGLYLYVGFGSFWLSMALAVGCYWGFLMWLFDLDSQDVGITLAIFILVRYAAGMILAMVATSM